MKFRFPILAVFCALSFGSAYGFATTDAPVEMQSPLFPKDSKDKKVAKENGSLKKFLLSTEGTYGWSPVKGTISYDFFPDGRLHIQGPDGEATMWQGKWSLKGDQLTLVNSDEKTTKTVTAKIDGDDLLLDEARYRRYKP